MVSAIIADGYLLKKKRDDRRNFLASKYQRRYFELTADTLAYAKDPRELKDGGGNIEVFAIHELKYIKKLEDCKLEMKFPERVLRVKAESIKEHDRWYETIKDARQKKLDGNNTPQAKQLETLKEQTKQQMMTTLEEDSDDDQPTGAAATVKKPDLQLAPINTSQPPNPGANNNRPPSPRSLLANPRMGTKMIAPTTRKNQQEEEEVEALQVAPKPRSRWQDEEEEEEEEVAQQQRKPQQQQKQQQQPVQPQHRVSGGNAKQAPPPAAAAPPSSERLMLNANQEPPGGGAKSGGTAGRGVRADVPLAAPRGEKLQLGDAGKQAAVAAPAATAAPPPAKGPSRENAEKLSLGGPSPPVTGSRGNTPPTGGHASGTDAAAPIESAREEWEDDDWDSSDDDEDDRKRAVASAAATAATAGRARPSQSSTSGRPGDASGSGRPAARGSSNNGGPAAAAPPGDEAAGSSGTGPRRVSGDDKVLRGISIAAGPGAAARKSSDRGSMGQQLPHAGYEAIKAVPGAQPAKGKVLQPSPRQQQRQEEEDKEAALAKHAAGTDHLEDNWDSDEEEEELPRKPQGRQAPPAPVAPSPRDSTVKTNGPQRRIPGPPPTAPAAARPTPPMAAPHALPTGIARPPTAPKQLAVGPTSSGPGARPRGRISHEDGLPPQPPAKAAGSSSSGGGGSATARHKLEIGEPATLRSNVVHDPNVKPDDDNWVEEDWDDDDD